MAGGSGGSGWWLAGTPGVVGQEEALGTGWQGFHEPLGRKRLRVMVNSRKLQALAVREKALNAG